MESVELLHRITIGYELLHLRTRLQCKLPLRPVQRILHCKTPMPQLQILQILHLSDAGFIRNSIAVVSNDQPFEIRVWREGNDVIPFIVTDIGGNGNELNRFGENGVAPTVDVRRLNGVQEGLSDV